MGYVIHFAELLSNPQKDVQIACNKYLDPRTVNFSKRIENVTCKRCRKTKSFKTAVSGKKLQKLSKQAEAPIPFLGQIDRHLTELTEPGPNKAPSKDKDPLWTRICNNIRRVFSS